MTTVSFSGFVGVDCICVDTLTCPQFSDRVLMTVVRELCSNHNYVLTNQQFTWRKNRRLIQTVSNRPIQRLEYKGEIRNDPLASLPGGFIILYSTLRGLSARTAYVYEFDRAGFAIACRRSVEILGAANMNLPHALALMARKQVVCETAFIDVEQFLALTPLLDTLQQQRSGRQPRADNDTTTDNPFDDYAAINELVMLQLTSDSSSTSSTRGASTQFTSMQTQHVGPPVISAHPLVESFRSCEEMEFTMLERSGLFLRICDVLSTAVVLLQWCGDTTQWRSIDHFYLLQLCVLFRGYYKDGYQRGVDTNYETKLFVANRLLTSAGTTMAFRGYPHQKPTAEELIDMVSRAMVRARCESLVYVRDLFCRGKFAELVNGLHGCSDNRAVRNSASICRPYVTNASEIKNYVATNLLFEYDTAVFDKFERVLRFSAADVTPLQLVSSVLAFVPNANATKQYMVVWTPSAYAIRTRAANASGPQYIYLCLDYATAHSIAFAGATVATLQVERSNTSTSRAFADHHSPAVRALSVDSVLATSTGLESDHSLSTMSAALNAFQMLTTAYLNRENDAWTGVAGTLGKAQICLANVDAFLHILTDDMSRQETRDRLAVLLLQPYVEMKTSRGVSGVPRRTMIGALHTLLAGTDCDLYLDRDSIRNLVFSPTIDAIAPVIATMLRTACGFAHSRVPISKSSTTHSYCCQCSTTAAHCKSIADNLQFCCLCAGFRTFKRSVPTADICTECLARNEAVPRRDADGYVCITGAPGCDYQSIISEFIRLRLTDALFGLCPARGNVVMPVVLPHNPALNSYYRTRAYKTDDVAAQQQRDELEADRVYGDIQRTFISHCQPSLDRRVERRLTVMMVLSKLARCDHARLVSIAATPQNIFFRLCDYTGEEMYRACNVDNILHAVQTQCVFPLCSSAFVETGDVGAYGFESNASNFTLSLEQRVYSSITTEHLLPRPLLGCMPLLLPLSLCNYNTI